MRRREDVPEDLYDSEANQCGCCCEPVLIGRHLLLWGKAHEPRGFPWQGMVGPDRRTAGLTALTVILCTAGWACIILLVWTSDKRVIVASTGLALAAVVLALEGRVACSDPGIVFRDTAPDVTETSAVRSVHLSGSASFADASRNPSSNAQNDEMIVGKVVSAPLHDERLATAAEAAAATAGEPNYAASSARSASGTLNQTAGSKYRGRGAPVHCGSCDITRPPNARHCNECGACVRSLDHHCPFTGQCIGRNNMNAFRVFVGCLWLLMAYVSGTLIITLVLRLANAAIR